MRGLRRKLVLLIMPSLLAFGFVSALAQPQARPSAVSIAITVTALGAGYLPAVIPQDHLAVSSGKTRLDVTGWSHPQANDDSLQLAILIDNNVKASLAGQPLEDLANFIKALPSAASVGVFFAEKGKATEAAAFSTDHPAVAKSLSQVAGANGESLRVYPSLADLAAHWPTPAAAHREILMIGSGYDALIGGMEDPNINAGQSVYTGSNYDPNIAGERDPYLNSMVEAVDRAGIEVHSIYVPDPRFAQMVQANIMRDKLIEVSTDTGGLSFFNGGGIRLPLIYVNWRTRSKANIS